MDRSEFYLSINFLGPVISGLILTLYHVAWIVSIIKQEENSVFVWNIKGKKKWVDHMTSNLEKNSILSIQALRNGLIPAQVFATTSSAVGFVVINFAMITEFPQLIKVLYWVFALLQFMCFLNMAIVLRNYQHLTFLLTTPATSADQDDGENDEQSTLTLSLASIRKTSYGLISKATIHWTLGLRFFYFSLPVAAWTVSSIACLITTIVLVVIMVTNDNILKKKAIHK